MQEVCGPDAAFVYVLVEALYAAAIFVVMFGTNISAEQLFILDVLHDGFHKGIVILEVGKMVLAACRGNAVFGIRGVLDGFGEYLRAKA